MEKIKEMLTGTAGSIVGAIVLLIVGMIVIKLLIFGLEHIRKRKRVDELREIGRWKE